MTEGIHKYKGDWVILRYDENDLNWKKNGRSEYRTGSGWKPGLKYAKIFWTEEDAAQELIGIRIRKAALFKKKLGLT